MPLRVPSIDGRPVGDSGFGQGPAITPDRSSEVNANQLQRAGQALGASGIAASNVGNTLIDEANDARSKQQATLHASELDQLVRGYEERLGEDAYDNRKDLVKAVEQLRGRYSKRLENKNQNAMYARMVDAQVRQAQGRIDTHYTRQTRAWNISQTEASINLNGREYQTAAQLGDRDEEERTARMSVARGVMLKEFDKLAQLTGLTGEAKTNMRAEQLAKLHAGTLDSLANVAPAQARDYFEENQDEMDPATRSRAQKVLDAADLKDKALETTRKLMGSAGEKATPTQRLQAVMDGAVKITDADEFNAVMSFAGAEYQRQVRIEAGTKNDLIEQVDKLVSAEGGEFLTFEQLPPTLQADLREQGLADEAMSLVTSRDRTTDEQVFLGVLFDPGVLKGVPPELFERTYRKDLSKRDYNAVRSIWAEVNNQSATPPMAPSVLSESDMVTTLLAEAGYTKAVIEGDPSKAAEAQALRESMQQARDQGHVKNDMSWSDRKKAYEQRVYQEKAHVGSRVVPKNANAVGAKVTVPLLGGGVVESLVGAVPDERVDGEQGVRSSLVSFMKTMNVEPTEVAIQQLWFHFRTAKTRKELLAALADPTLSVSFRDALKATARPPASRPNNTMYF
jgi:hypothetical protein